MRHLLLLCFRVLQCWKAIALESLCPLKSFDYGSKVRQSIHCEGAEEDGISTMIARSLDGFSTRPKKVVYMMGSNQEQSSENVLDIYVIISR